MWTSRQYVSVSRSVPAIADICLFSSWEAQPFLALWMMRISIRLSTIGCHQSSTSVTFSRSGRRTGPFSASLSPNGWLSILSCGKDYQFSYFLIGASTDLIRGGITLLHIPCNSFATLFVVRFFLGVAEASIVPAFLLILSMFFTYQEQAVLMPIMWSIGNASPITSGLLSYGVLWIKTGTFAPWKWFMGMSLVGEAKNRARHLSIHSHHWWSDSGVWVGSVALLP